MTNIEMWNLIAGFVTPLVVAVLNRPNWAAGVKSMVAFVVSAVLGVVTCYLNGSLDGQTIITSILLVLVTAISTYKGFWQPTGVADVIELTTSPRRTWDNPIRRAA